MKSTQEPHAASTVKPSLALSAAQGAVFLTLHAGRLAWRHQRLGTWAGKGLRWAGKASGYVSALHAWMEFAGDRRTAPFLKASATTGLALARVHPILNLSLSALSFTDYPDRAFESVARRLPSGRNSDRA
jgi:hypothetical protein